MSIQKFRFQDEEGHLGKELTHKIKSVSILKRFITRNGYIPKINSSSMKRGPEDLFIIYLNPPQGPRRVTSSKGFRTCYRITCKGFHELTKALVGLGYNENNKG